MSIKPPPEFEPGSKALERITAAAKGVAGAVPIAGSLIAEFLGQVIPNQRLERIEAYLRALSDHLKGLGENRAKEIAGQTTSADLFEDGVHSAARALSPERLTYIAKLVADGMRAEESEKAQYKRLLRLLGAIDDDQIVILASYLHKHLHDDEFRERHKSVLEPIAAHIGSDTEELDRETAYQLARAQLISLGLLKHRYKRPSRGELPEFDERTGMFKSSGKELTSLGRLLLRRIGVAGPDDL